MLKKLGQVIFKNRAGLMMLGAGLGVGAVAFFATKDAEDFKEVKEAWKEKEATGQEVPMKEKLIAYGKGHWRAGIAILGTELLMIFSHRTMAKELAAVTGAMAILGSNYKEIDEYFKKNYPKEYTEFKKTVNAKNIRSAFASNEKFTKQETYDGRNRYYDPWSCQIFFATEAEIKEAECTVNELMVNTGAATLFDYLATFPSSSGVKLQPWMKYFGWYEGDTSYSYSAGYFGPYLKPTISKEKIIFKGEEEELFTISWCNNPDLDPDLSSDECNNIDELLKDLSDEEPDVKVDSVA